MNTRTSDKSARANSPDPSNSQTRWSQRAGKTGTGSSRGVSGASHRGASRRAVARAVPMRMSVQVLPKSLRPYAGMRPPTDDQEQRAHQMAFTLVTDLLAGPDTPVGRMVRNGVLLCEATQDYLYSPKHRFGFLSREFHAGAQPVLEAHVQAVTQSGMNLTQRVIAISQSLRELPARYGQTPCPLYGESDEQTLLKGGGQSMCMARLLVALCQVTGAQARPVLFHAHPDPTDAQVVLGGHAGVEVLLDGQWVYFDPLHHFHCMEIDEKPRSARDLWRDPDLLTRLPTAMLRQLDSTHETTELRGRAFLADYARRNFGPTCPIMISRHEANAAFRVKWTWATVEFRQGLLHDQHQFLEALMQLAERGGITDAVYRMGVDEVRELLRLHDWKLPSQAQSGDLDATGIRRVIRKGKARKAEPARLR